MTEFSETYCAEIEDAYRKGERPGKAGQGSPNKVPFVAAVQTTKAK